MYDPTLWARGEGGPPSSVVRGPASCCKLRPRAHRWAGAARGDHGDQRRVARGARARRGGPAARRAATAGRRPSSTAMVGPPTCSCRPTTSGDSTSTLERLDPKFVDGAGRARGQAVLAAPRRRRRSRSRARRGPTSPRGRRRVGRLDAVDAARALARAARAHDAEQADRHVPRAAARSAAVEAGDPRGLPRAHAVRRQRRGRRVGGVVVLRARRAAPDAARDRDAARGAAGPVALRADAAQLRAAARAARRDPRQADRGGRVHRGRRDAARSPRPRTTAPPDQLRPMPREAPHAAAAAARALSASERAIRSTLDAGHPGARREAGRAARATSCTRKGIHNAAIVVVDHRTREVVALVGNLDFTDATHGGQIAMFDRAALAGLDAQAVPLRAGDRSRRSRCPSTSCRRADPVRHVSPAQLRRRLARASSRCRTRSSRSLNLPFIDLLASSASSPSSASSRSMGVAPRTRSAGPTYGLSLIVGGIELTPLELAGHLRDARRGRRVPPAAAGRRPIRPPRGAADLRRRAPRTSRARHCRSSDRPDFPRRRDVNGVPPDDPLEDRHELRLPRRVGRRLGARVHRGRVDRQRRQQAERRARRLARPPARCCSTCSRASPIARRQPRSRAPPDDLTEVEVCAYSGHIAGEACDASREGARADPRRADDAVPVSPAFDVDRVTARGRAARVPDRRHALRRKSFVVLPSAVTRVADRAQPRGPRGAGVRRRLRRRMPAPPIIAHAQPRARSSR